MSGSFALDLSRIIAKAKGNVDLVVQKTTMDLFAAVINKTPVDTGRARGNWQASVGNYGKTSDQNMMDKTGEATTAKAAEVAMKTPAGNVVYLVNSLPYIQILEYGRASGKPGSLQAPHGMVRITAVEFQQHFEKATRSI